MKGLSKYMKDLSFHCSVFLKNSILFADFGPNPLLGYQDVAQFVKTNGGAEKLMDSEGYVYYKKKTNTTKYFWDCVSRKKFGCRGRATTEGFMIYSRTEHNHSPPIGKFHGNMK